MVVNGYITLDDAVSYLGASMSAPTDFVEECITSASRLIDAITGRTFSTEGTILAPVGRTFDATGTDTVVVDEIDTITAVDVDDGTGTWPTTYTASDYQTSARGRGWPTTSIRLLAATFPSQQAGMRSDLIRVTGVWGWGEIPAEVAAACRLISAELVKLRDAPLGIAGGSDFGVAYVRRQIPSRAQSMLDPYRTAETFGVG